MRVLILGCDRPDYLIQVLDSINEGEVFVLLDRPKTDETIPFHNQCKALLKKRGIQFEANEKNLGCSKSMYKLLSKVEQGEVVMVLEDDTVLLPDYEKLFDLIPAGDFVIKMSDFFWGWIANYGAIKKLLGFKDGDFETENKEIEFIAIKEFKKAGVEILWDKHFQAAIKYTGIHEIKTKVGYVRNIGVLSSRQKTKQVASFATFVNGEFKDVTQI